MKAHDKFEHYTHFHEPYAFVNKSDVAVSECDSNLFVSMCIIALCLEMHYI